MADAAGHVPREYPLKIFLKQEAHCTAMPQKISTRPLHITIDGLERALAVELICG